MGHVWPVVLQLLLQAFDELLMVIAVDELDDSLLALACFEVGLLKDHNDTLPILSVFEVLWDFGCFSFEPGPWNSRLKVLIF